MEKRFNFQNFFVMPTKELPNIRLSASSMERLHACPSSFAKQNEFKEFIEEEGIKLQGNKEASLGTDLHKVLEGIKFVPNKKKDKGFDLRFVRESANKLNYNIASDDAETMGKFINRRDYLVEYFLKRCTKFGKVKGIELAMDDERMFAEFQTGDQKVQFSGLPDVKVSCTLENDEKKVMILDYKTLFGDQTPSHANLQLAALAGLSKINDKDVSGVFVALITRDSIYEKPRLTHYDNDLLDKAVSLMRSGATKAKELEDLRKLDAEKAEPELVKNAETGDHCKYCNGQACCAKFKRDTVEKIDLLKTQIEKLTTKPEDMTKSDLLRHKSLTKHLADLSKSADKSSKEADKYIRELSKTQEISEVSLGAGRKTLSIKDNAEGKTMSPIEIYETLEEHLEGVSKEEFLSEVSAVSSTAIRSYLADKLEVSSSTMKFVSEMGEKMGENNIFTIKEGDASVKVNVKFAKEIVEEELAGISGFGLRDTDLAEEASEELSEGEAV